MPDAVDPRRSPRESVFVRAARGEAVPHTPVWFMRQAGRSLPEYRKVREGVGMLESCMRPDLITEITLQGPGAGGPQTASAVLGDVISAMIPPAQTPPTRFALPIVEDVESAFYLHMEVDDRPGVLAQVAEVLGMQGASIKSVVQKGLGAHARLVMVVHPISESRFFGAVEVISRLDFLRSHPRAIRVIEEHYD